MKFDNSIISGRYNEIVFTLMWSFIEVLLYLSQVPGGDVYTGVYTMLINGLRGVYFQDHARLTYDSGEMPDTFAVHLQTDKGIYKPGQTGI